MVVLVDHTINLPVESCHWQDLIRDEVYECRVAAIFAAIISTASPGEVFDESMTSHSLAHGSYSRSTTQGNVGGIDSLLEQRLHP